MWKRAFRLKLRSDSRFQHAFTACNCVFKLITLDDSNQGNYFENAISCSKCTLKTTVATQLYRHTNFNLPCRAFLLRQKSTGEEVVVMMTPIKASGVTSKTVVSRIPAYVSTSGKISTPPRKKARLFWSYTKHWVIDAERPFLLKMFWSTVPHYLFCVRTNFKCNLKKETKLEPKLKWQFKLNFFSIAGL